jgi:hypothetical protein
MVRNGGESAVRVGWIQADAVRVVPGVSPFAGGREEGKGPAWRAYPDTTRPGEVLWAWCSRQTLQPDEVAECIIRFASPPRGTVRLELGAGGETLLRGEVPICPASVRISDINFNKERTEVYAYLENTSGETVTVNSARLLERAAAVSGVEGPLGAGRKKCLRFHPPGPLPFGERTYVLVDLSNGERVAVSAPAYGVFPIEVSGEAGSGLYSETDGIRSRMILDRYGQFHDWQDAVACKVMHALRDSRRFRDGNLPIARVNQGFIADAVVTLGELTPCFYVACEPVEAEYLGRYDERDFHYTQAKARYIKEAVSPNLPWLGMRTFHGYDSFDKEMTPAELRLGVYYLISRGAKGVFYQTKFWGSGAEEWQRDMRAEMNGLNQELVLMRGLLRIAEPVEHVAETSEPLVEAATLLAGERGLVIVLLNHDRSFAWPEQEIDNKEPFWIVPKPDPIGVTVEIPAGVRVRGVYEVGGAWVVAGFEQKGDSLSFMVDELQATRQFIVSFVPGADREAVLSERSDGATPRIMPAEAGDDRPAVEEGAPDVQFEKKQHFFGGVDPAAGAVQCEFSFRNAGESPLLVAIERVDGQLAASVDSGCLAAGESSVVRVEYYPSVSMSGKFKALVEIKTNDPNEPMVSLLLGGVIEPEVAVSPRCLVLTDEKPSVYLRVQDNREGVLEIEGVESSFRDLSWRVIRTEEVRSVSRAEVFRGDVVDRAYDILVEAAPSLARGGYQTGRLVITTNAAHHREITVPVEIEPERKCVVMPSTLFFGKVGRGERVSAACALSSRGDLGIGRVWSEGDGAEGEAFPVQAGHAYRLNVSFQSTKRGLVTGKVNVKVILDGREETISVPYTALVR